MKNLKLNNENNKKSFIFEKLKKIVKRSFIFDIISVSISGFFNIFKKFKTLFFCCLFLNILNVILKTQFAQAISIIFENFTKNSGDFFKINFLTDKEKAFWIDLNFIKKYFSFEFSTKNPHSFLLPTIFFLFLSGLMSFLEKFFENLITDKSFYFVKNLLMEKFSRLSVEDKIVSKSDLMMAIDEDVENISKLWHHIPIHIINNIFSIFLSFSKIKDQIRSRNEIIFLASFILVSIITNYALTFLIHNKSKNIRDAYKKEVYLTEKEISKAPLIESMGMNSEYSRERNNLSKNILEELKTIYALISFFESLSPFTTSIVEILFFVSFFQKRKPNLTSSVWCAKNVYSNSLGIMRNVYELSNLSVSLKSANRIFSLQEKNENISEGILLSNEKIESISFENVSFKYKNNENFVIDKYNRKFSPSDLNRISGKNGTGKTTTIYLTIGMIKPQEGKIIIRLSDGREFDLFKQVNLKDWKENVIAYFSYDNLLEQNEGSTGQRQIKSIDDTISKKKIAQIFIFDEANNSLDKEKKIIFHKKLENLVLRKKIVISIEH